MRRTIVSILIVGMMVVTSIPSTVFLLEEENGIPSLNEEETVSDSIRLSTNIEYNTKTDRYQADIISYSASFGKHISVPIAINTLNKYQLKIDLMETDSYFSEVPFFEADVDKNRISYQSYDSTVELEYRCTIGGLKESIIINSPIRCPENGMRFSFGIDARYSLKIKNLDEYISLGSFVPSNNEEHDVFFENHWHEPIFRMITPSATDASGREVGIRVIYERVVDSYLVTSIHIPRNELLASEYPIIIDPPIQSPVDGELSFSDQTIIQDGDIQITTGKLKLDNCTLKVDGSYDGEYSIDVQSGGELRAYFTTFTTNDDQSYSTYDFSVAGKLTAVCSEIKYTNDGLKLNSNEVVIKQTTISTSNDEGVEIQSGDPIFKGCSITDNSGAGIEVTSGSTPAFLNTSIYSNGDIGIMCDQADVILFDSDVSSNTGIGVKFMDSGGEVLNCTISENGDDGIQILSGSTTKMNYCSFYENDGEGIYIHSSDPILQNITISEHDSHAGILLDTSTGIINSTYVHNCQEGMRVKSSTSEISNVTISSSTQKGLIVEESTMEVQNSTVFGSSDSDLHIVSAQLTLVDSYFDETKIGFVDDPNPSNLDVFWTVDLTGVDSEGIPDSNVAFALKDVSQTQVASGTTDSEGKLPLLVIKDYDKTSSLKTKKNPHSITIGCTTISAFEICTPKSIIIGTEGDSDIDGIKDSKEAQGTTFFEAEDHFLDPTQFYYDSQFSMMTGLKPSANDEFVDSSSYPSIGSGIYLLVVGMMQDDVDGKLSLDIDVDTSDILDATIELQQTGKLVYTTRLFQTSGGTLKISLTDISNVDCQILVDYFLLVAVKQGSTWNRYTGGISHPLMGDSDYDSVADGEEIRENQFWIEVEDFSHGSEYTLSDERCSNGKAAFHKDDDRSIFKTDDISFSCERGLYTFALRGRHHEGWTSGKVHVDIKYSGATQESWDFEMPPEYEYTDAETFVLTQDVDITIVIEDKEDDDLDDATPPRVYIDCYLLTKREHVVESQWTYNTGASCQAVAPTLVSDWIAQPHLDEVEFIDDTGTLYWSKSISGGPVSGVTYEGLFFLGSNTASPDHGYLYALDPDTKQEAWTRYDLGVGFKVGEPIVYDGKVLVCAEDPTNDAAKLVAISIDDGTLAWQQEYIFNEFLPRSPPIILHDVCAVLVEPTDENSQYTDNYYFVTVDISDGTELSGSPHSIEDDPDIKNRPVYSDGMVFYSSCEGTDHCVCAIHPDLEAAQWKKCWCMDDADDDIKFALVIVDGNVIGVDEAGNIYVIEENTGSVSRKIQLDDPPTAPPSIGYMNMYIPIKDDDVTPDDYYLYKYDLITIIEASSTAQWTYGPHSSSYTTNPIISDIDEDGFLDIILCDSVGEVDVLSGGGAWYRDQSPWCNKGRDAVQSFQAQYVDTFFRSNPLRLDTDIDGLADSGEFAVSMYDRVEFEDFSDHDGINFLRKGYLTKKAVAGTGPSSKDWIVCDVDIKESGVYYISTQINGEFKFRTNPPSMERIPKEDLRKLENNALAVAPVLTLHRGNLYVDTARTERPFIDPIEEIKGVSFFDCKYKEDPNSLYTFSFSIRVWSYEGEFELGKGNHKLGLTINDEAFAIINSNLPSDVEFMGLELIADYFHVSKMNVDPMDGDFDDDTLLDAEEIQEGTYPLNSDPDEDGLGDARELEHDTNPEYRDTDCDGVRDLVELSLSKGTPERPKDTTTPYDDDTTGSRSSEFERTVRNGGVPTDGAFATVSNIDVDDDFTSPTIPDSDFDGLPDGIIDGWWHIPWSRGQGWGNDVDPDSWGFFKEADCEFKGWEYEDFNCDGDKNGAGGFIETDACNPDSDSDDLPDGWERWHFMNPNSNANRHGGNGDADIRKLGDDSWYYQSPDDFPLGLDIDNPPTGYTYDPDGASNLEEYIALTNPLASDTDDDNLKDSIEIDNVFLRTNVPFGGLKFDSYQDADATNWIFFAGCFYTFDSIAYDPVAGTSCTLSVDPWGSLAVSDEDPRFLARLQDGTDIVYDWDEEAIGVWSPGALRESSYYGSDGNNVCEGTLVKFVLDELWSFQDNFNHDNVVPNGNCHWDFDSNDASTYSVEGGMISLVNYPNFITFRDDFLVNNVVPNGMQWWTFETNGISQYQVANGVITLQNNQVGDYARITHMQQLNEKWQADIVTRLTAPTNPQFMVDLRVQFSPQYKLVHSETVMGGSQWDVLDGNDQVIAGVADPNSLYQEFRNLHFVKDDPNNIDVYLNGQLLISIPSIGTDDRIMIWYCHGSIGEVDLVDYYPLGDAYAGITHMRSFTDSWKSEVHTKMTKMAILLNDYDLRIQFSLDMYLCHSEGLLRWDVLDSFDVVHQTVPDPVGILNNMVELRFERIGGGDIEVYLDDNYLIDITSYDTEDRIHISYTHGSDGVVDEVCYYKYAPSDPLHPRTLDPILEYRMMEVYTTNPFERDSDFDCISDDLDWSASVPYDVDLDDIIDPRDIDSDGDRVVDGWEDKYRNGVFEPNRGETDPFNPDTDGDGLTDFEDEMPLDYDNDGLKGFSLNHMDESVYGCSWDDPDTDDDGLHDGDEVFVYHTKPFDESQENRDGYDTDGDGLNDYEEIFDYGTNPCEDDSDMGGTDDKTEIDVDETDPLDPTDDFDGSLSDTDEDGIPDTYENTYEFLNLYSYKDAWENEDEDSIEYYSNGYIKEFEYSNRFEWYVGSDPESDDSDGDTLKDSFEFVYGLTPIKIGGSTIDEHNQDPDNDGLTNFQEQSERTHPFNRDTDGDGFLDGEEVSNGMNPVSLDSDGDFFYDFEDDYPTVFTVTEDISTAFYPDTVGLSDDGLASVQVKYISGDGGQVTVERYGFNHENALDDRYYKFKLANPEGVEFEAVYKIKYDESMLPSTISEHEIEYTLFNEETGTFRLPISQTLGESWGLDTEHDFVWVRTNHFSGDPPMVGNDQDGDGLADNLEMFNGIFWFASEIIDPTDDVKTQLGEWPNVENKGDMTGYDERFSDFKDVYWRVPQYIGEEKNTELEMDALWFNIVEDTNYREEDILVGAPATNPGNWRTSTNSWLKDKVQQYHRIANLQVKNVRNGYYRWFIFAKVTGDPLDHILHAEFSCNEESDTYSNSKPLKEIYGRDYFYPLKNNAQCAIGGYHWYATRTFESKRISDSGKWAHLSTCDLDIFDLILDDSYPSELTSKILVKYAFLVRVDLPTWQMESNQITYFKDPDTDDDGISDGDEVHFMMDPRGLVTPLVYWVEAENSYLIEDQMETGIQMSLRTTVKNPSIYSDILGKGKEATNHYPLEQNTNFNLIRGSDDTKTLYDIYIAPQTDDWREKYSGQTYIDSKIESRLPINHEVVWNEYPMDAVKLEMWVLLRKGWTPPTERQNWLFTSIPRLNCDEAVFSNDMESVDWVLNPPQYFLDVQDTIEVRNIDYGDRDIWRPIWKRVPSTIEFPLSHEVRITGELESGILAVDRVCLMAPLLHSLTRSPRIPPDPMSEDTDASGLTDRDRPVLKVEIVDASKDEPSDFNMLSKVSGEEDLHTIRGFYYSEVFGVKYRARDATPNTPTYNLDLEYGDWVEDTNGGPELDAQGRYKITNPQSCENFPAVVEECDCGEVLFTTAQKTEFDTEPRQGLLRASIFESDSKWKTNYDFDDTPVWVISRASVDEPTVEQLENDEYKITIKTNMDCTLFAVISDMPRTELLNRISRTTTSLYETDNKYRIQDVSVDTQGLDFTPMVLILEPSDFQKDGEFANEWTCTRDYIEDGINPGRPYYLYIEPLTTFKFFHKSEDEDHDFETAHCINWGQPKVHDFSFDWMDVVTDYHKLSTMYNDHKNRNWKNVGENNPDERPWEGDLPWLEWEKWEYTNPWDPPFKLQMDGTRFRIDTGWYYDVIQHQGVLYAFQSTPNINSVDEPKLFHFFPYKATWDKQYTEWKSSYAPWMYTDPNTNDEFDYHTGSEFKGIVDGFYELTNFYNEADAIALITTDYPSSSLLADKYALNWNILEGENPGLCAIYVVVEEWFAPPRVSDEGGWVYDEFDNPVFELTNPDVVYSWPTNGRSGQSVDLSGLDATVRSIPGGTAMTNWGGNWENTWGLKGGAYNPSDRELSDHIQADSRASTEVLWHVGSFYKFSFYLQAEGRTTGLNSVDDPGSVVNTVVTSNFDMELIFWIDEKYDPPVPEDP